MEKIINILNASAEEDQLISAIWSNPRNSSVPFKKITAKPVLIKGDYYIQFATLQNNQEKHHNILINHIDQFIKEYCQGFKQLQIFTSTSDYQCLINKKNIANIKKKPATKKKEVTLFHNRSKNYILDTPKSELFLQELGIMDHSRKIKPSKYDKYKQINKYLETIESILPELDTEEKIRIIDFGCGKSYLTFAMYHYFKEIHNKDIEIIGLDLKEDVIAFCNELATTLKYDNLHFQVGDIGQYTTNASIDVVVSLHACNTATDAALAKAIDWKAKVILAVPCCHHEAYTQIDNELLAPILKHGILKERIAALITDGLRAELLESKGYKVNVMEFIDMSHTPKNILIKAVAKDLKNNKEVYEKYKQTSDSLNLNLSLESLLSSHFED